MRKTFLLMPAIFLFGCAAELTTEGSSIRLVDDKSNCEFLGTVTGFNSAGINMAHNTEGAMNELRNKAALMGANSVKIISVETVPQGTTTLAEALYCAFD